MSRWTPDPIFYPSPQMATQSDPERFGYVAAMNYGRSNRPDEICVVDLDPQSNTYSKIVNRLNYPI
jgi:selenium-binding protein 1